MQASRPPHPRRLETRRALAVIRPERWQIQVAITDFTRWRDLAVAAPRGPYGKHTPCIDGCRPDGQAYRFKPENGRRSTMTVACDRRSVCWAKLHPKNVSHMTYKSSKNDHNPASNRLKGSPSPGPDHSSLPHKARQLTLFYRWLPPICPIHAQSVTNSAADG